MKLHTQKKAESMTTKHLHIYIFNITVIREKLSNPMFFFVNVFYV